MEGCEYCSESAGCGNDGLLLGKVKFEHGIDLLDINVFINCYNKLELYVDDSSCDEICKSTIKINYCPMCGRRLVREQNNLSNGKEV